MKTLQLYIIGVGLFASTLAMANTTFRSINGPIQACQYGKFSPTTQGEAKITEISEPGSPYPVLEYSDSKKDISVENIPTLLNNNNILHFKKQYLATNGDKGIYMTGFFSNDQATITVNIGPRTQDPQTEHDCTVRFTQQVPSAHK